MNKIIFETKNLLAHYLAKELISLANNGNIKNVALSGGSTPQAIFDVMASEYNEIINWQNIRFFWVDERCVPPTHNDSNYGMTKKHLLDKIEIKNENICRIKCELQPLNALNEYIISINNNVSKKNGFPEFDLIILGMGDDGHTASIFPHEINLWNSDNICEIGHHPITNQERITLSGKVINNAKKIIFLITGSNKARKVKDIFTKNISAQKYPAYFVDITKSLWLFDKDAACLI
ncbi:MAG: 6-phosphogluconolactonase [Marinilabiliaceae bacterium]|nr:6-phosphogluconolactonase [Marinilabiliaceae bacterium]